MPAKATQEPKSKDYTATVRELDATKSGAQDDAMRQAVLAVVQIWLNRLALVSGITTFFASIDSLLFSLASTATHIGDPDTSGWNAIDKLTTASFAGALIFHVCSAIVAFAGSFVLVRLQLVDADQQEHEAGIPAIYAEPMREVSDMRENSLSLDNTLRPSDTFNAAHAGQPQWRAAYNGIYSRVVIRRLVAKRPKGPVDSLLDPGPPVELLSRCNALAVVMAVLGFILAVLGILAYAWTATPLSVSIFSSACLGGCIIATCIAIW
ncbi:hypothetical protein BKA93DRAFT_749302 [Sparassis latifolia]|uniref:Transmembrane protein n=1 Tax=Sparassis crispa TaxID=139825 RepID=A0A401GF06_9APHY|nr:predicted protein [Sparassis crispa]GBE80749.1 predicted protein [Sparassis crispa]